LVVTIFDAELVGRGGLALADAFDLRGVEGIELPSALALLLRSDLRSARQRRFEGRLEFGTSFNLAADVADDPAEPAAQQAQLAMVALELLGMGIAGSHHGRAFGDTQIGLPQPQLAFAGQPVKPVDCCMQQLGIGWEGDGLGLHGGVHRDPFEIACAQRAGVVGDP
jgi:hypothetical protein